MNLYQLTQERLELQTKLIALDFDAETIADTLEGESTAIQAKIEDYGYVIKNMSGLANATREEGKRIMALADARDKQVDNIKAWLLANMQACSISKIECPAFAISVKNNPPKVVIDNAGQIPSDLYTYPVAPEPFPDKKAISAKLKAGEEVQGCHLEQGQRIEIK